jgi:hypothetical protein
MILMLSGDKDVVVLAASPALVDAIIRPWQALTAKLPGGGT